MKPIDKRIQMRTVFILLVLAMLYACALFRSPPEPLRVDTLSILFKCDSEINQGMLLPVDVIFITADDNMKEVTKIGPTAWFDSEERQSWAHRQTLSLRSGVEVRLILNKPPETKSIVIFASFFQVEDQHAQQVIIEPDPEGNGAVEEVIWVSSAAIYL
jgi:hypothetical protein